MLLFTELKHLDNSHRHELEQVTDRKVSIWYESNFIPLFIVTAQNVYTHRCLTVLHHISSLNSELVHLPPALSALQSSFRGKTSFPHIQRLHTMLYAYGATIIEIVRRKEFCKPFPYLFGISGKDVIVAFIKLDSSISVLRASLRLWPKLRELHKLKILKKAN